MEGAEGRERREQNGERWEGKEGEGKEGEGKWEERRVEEGGREEGRDAEGGGRKEVRRANNFNQHSKKNSPVRRCHSLAVECTFPYLIFVHFVFRLFVNP